MTKRGRKSVQYYIPKIEEYFAPLLAKCPSLSNKERDTLARLVFHSLETLRCLVEENGIDIDKIDSHSSLRKLSHVYGSGSDIGYLAKEIMDAVDLLFLYNMRLVRRIMISIAKVNPDAVNEEMFDRAFVATCRAIYNYDPYRGISLSTYISWYVRKMAGAEYEKNARNYSIEPPVWVLHPSKIFNVNNYRKLLKTRSPKEVFGSYPRIFLLSCLEKKEVVSLYDKNAVDEEFENVIGSFDYDTSDSLDVSKYLDILDNVEKDIVKQYFGFDGDPKSLYRIAIGINKSTEYVRKKLNGAISKLKEQFAYGNN